MSEETDKPRRLDVDWVKVVAGALAAVSSAVLLSTLGAAGTLIGAALGSVIVSITTSFYGQTLAKGTEKVAEAQTVALRKVTSATQDIRVLREETADAADPGASPRGPATGTDAPELTAEETDAVLEQAEEQLAEATEELERAQEETAAVGTGEGRPGLRERLAILPWKRIGIVTAGTFVVAMVLVTAFEVIGGQSLSSYTNPRDSGSGTSIGGLLGGGSTTDDSDRVPGDDTTDDTTPRPGSPATDQPTDPSTSGDVDPSDGATSTPRDDATPSDEPTDEPTEDDESPTTPTTPPTPTVPPTSPTR